MSDLRRSEVPPEVFILRREDMDRWKQKVLHDVAASGTPSEPRKFPLEMVEEFIDYSGAVVTKLLKAKSAFDIEEIVSGIEEHGIAVKYVDRVQSAV